VTHDITKEHERTRAVNEFKKLKGLYKNPLLQGFNEIMRRGFIKNFGGGGGLDERLVLINIQHTKI
jgi:hypothetical protein